MVFHILFFHFVFSAPDPDLSDDLISEDDEDGEDSGKEDEKEEEEVKSDWNWTIGEGPAPFFESNNPVEGQPISLPLFSKELTPLQFFYQMLPKSFCERAVVETNKYASEKLQTGSPAMKAAWKPVDAADVFRFLAIIISMGIVRVRRKKDLWEKKSPEVIRYPTVAHVLSRKRFCEIKRFFHLEDNKLAAPYGTEEYDPLHKIRKLYDCLQLRFKNTWRMGTYASIDESMTNWKGRSRFKQYVRSKPIRWGYKFFCMCDPKTGYIKDFELYLGKRTVGEQVGLCSDIVLKLAERCSLSLTKSIVVADNYYSSPTLVALLAQKGIGYVGTCQLGRKHVPRSLLQQSTRGATPERGTTKKVFIEMKSAPELSSEATIYLCSWRDTKIVNFIGSAEGLAMTTVTRRTRSGSEVTVPAPMLVKTYVQRMGGVDLADMNKSRYSIAGTLITRKWWFRFLLVSLIWLLIIAGNYISVQ